MARKTFTLKANKSERGSALVEYALLIALIALIVIGAVVHVGRTARGKFECVRNGMSGETIGPVCNTSDGDFDHGDLD